MSNVIYVAMDVHLKLIAVVWGRAKDKRHSMVVENSPEGWAKLVQAVGTKDVWGVYEASSCGFEVYDHFTGLGWTMSVVAPTHLPKSAHGRKRKTDLRDAKGLWDVLVAHGELGTELPEVWIPHVKLREEREVVRRRLAVADHLTRLKNSIHGLMRMHRIKRPEVMKRAWSEKHLAWLRGLLKDEELGSSLRGVLESYLREFDFLRKELENLQAQVELLSEDPSYQGAVCQMTQLEGVGILTAMTFLVELGDVRRFDNRRQVASYLGLVPSSFESGEATDRKGHITRSGPARVRKVLNQAAWHLVRLNPRWKARFGPLAERRGAKRAIVGIMRRLGIEMWHRAQAA